MSRGDNNFDNQISKTQMALDLLIKAYRNSGNEYEEILRMQQELLGFQTEKAIQVTHYLTSLAKLDYLTSKSE